VLLAWQVRLIDGYIAVNLDRHIRVDELALLVRLSASHFSRSFRQSRGLAPGQYLVRRRVDHAQALMLSTGASLARIATDCGLADQSHFCRIFRKVTGESPRAWRHIRCGGLGVAAAGVYAVEHTT